MDQETRAYFENEFKTQKQENLEGDLKVENFANDNLEENSISKENGEETTLNKSAQQAKSKIKKEKEKDKDKEKEKVTKSNSGPTSKFKIDLDLNSFQEAFDKFKSAYFRANNKSIGRTITEEEIFARLLDFIDDALILELQKKSLTEEELNTILRSHINKSVVQ